MERFEPLADRVLVKSDAVAKQVGVVMLAENRGDKPSTAVVEEVSSEVRNKSIKKGAHIMYGKHAGVAITLNGEQFLILREAEIFGIIKN